MGSPSSGSISQVAEKVAQFTPSEQSGPTVHDPAHPGVQEQAPPPVQLPPLGQVPQLPPQPSSPQLLPLQSGEQGA